MQSIKARDKKKEKDKREAEKKIKRENKR